jgi:hypothetical protein
LKTIKPMPAEDIEKILTLLRREINSEPPPEKTISNLAALIAVLAQEPWGDVQNAFQRVPFEIDEKISFNKLRRGQTRIRDYAVYCGRVQAIYDEFDVGGTNKSLSVLQVIRTDFSNIDTRYDADSRLVETIKLVRQRIIRSKNYINIPDEELELCINILVVDAFVRCKIFDSPIGVTNVASR